MRVQGYFLFWILIVSLYGYRILEDEEEESDSDDTPCLINSDCNEPWETCHEEDLICVHKSLFPIEPMEIAGTIVLPILVSMANAGGIGGGGIIVPLCMLFFQFDTSEAVALSHFTIFASSLTRYLFNFD